MSNDPARARLVTARSAITRSLRFIVTGIPGALALTLLGLALSTPAEAESPHAWSEGTTVCVESHVGPEWGLRSALRTWNALDSGPTFILEDVCSDCDDTVTVSDRSRDDRYTGWTKWYWDDAGLIVHADVTVNPHRIKAFADRERSCQRQHTMTHEFGHVLGLRHYPHSHAGSVMSYLGWERHCGSLSAHDRADFRGLYSSHENVQGRVS